MNSLLKYSGILLLFIFLVKPASAQRYYDNIYKATNADMVKVNGSSRIEHVLTGAIVILSNSSNQLNILINIPCNAMNSKVIDDSCFSNPLLPFSLTLKIDPTQIQEELTSNKTFTANGTLTLNNIIKTIPVQYIPMASGTEENGNFSIYMAIQFNANDFNLDDPNSNAFYIIKLNNAAVNRV